MPELSFGVKIWGDISNLVKSLTSGKGAVGGFTQDTSRQFRDLTKSVAIAENQFKNLAVQFGRNSKEASGALAEFHKLKAELNGINNALRPPPAAHSTWGDMKKEIIGIGAGYLAATKIIDTFTDTVKQSIEAAMDEERQTKRLEFALNGNADAVQRMERFRQRLMETTLFSKDDINAATNMALSMGRTEDETRKMIVTAMGISRATGGTIDLNTAMMQLNGTYEGSAGRLGRLEGSIKDLTKAQLQNGEGVDILNKKYAKFATEGITSMEGQVKQMKKFWNESLEDMGFTFMNIFKGMQAYVQRMGGSIGVDRHLAVKLMGEHNAELRDDIASKKALNAQGVVSKYWQDREKVASDTAEILKQQEESLKKQEESSKQILDSVLKYQKALYEGTLVGPRGGMTYGELDNKGGATGITRMQPKGFPTAKIGGLHGGSMDFTKSKTSMDDWSKAIDKVMQKAGGLNSTFQSVFSSIANLASQVATGFKDGWMGAMEAVGAVVQSGAQLIGELFSKQNEKRLAELDEYYNSEKDRIEGSRMSEKQKAKAMQQLDEQTAQKKKALLREQAKQQKTVSLMQAIVAGALAVVQAFASGPGIGVVLGLLMTGLVAAQIAAIATQPLPALASGGLAYAPTMALVGDNKNARVDPEVISPLSKLKELFFGNERGAETLSVRVSGDDLRFILQRAEYNSGRRYGR